MRFWMIGVVVCVVFGCDKADDKAATGSAGNAGNVGSAGAGSAVAPGSAAPIAVAGSAAAAPVGVPPVTAHAAPPPVAWKEGDKVQGKWSDGRWYNGRISAVNSEGTYNIKYDDGDVSNHFGTERIRARGTVTPATGQSHAGGGNNNAPCPGPGLTRRCGGVCVNLQEDSNNCGTCGNRCQNGKHCDGHLFCRDAEGNL